MSDEPKVNPEQPQGDSGASWQEVGRQFEALGASLAEAFRTAWKGVESNKEAQEMKSGLESMLRQVGQAIEDAASTPEAMKVKAEAKKTAESLRTAGEETVREVRPQIITGLQKANEELQKLIERMNRPEKPADPPNQG